MADPKKPESTRPFRIVSGGQDRKDRTQPIPTTEDKTEKVASDKTERVTSPSVTRPTGVVRTGPVPPVRPPVPGTGQRPSGTGRPVLRQTGPAAPVRQTGAGAAVRQSGTGKAVRQTGQTSTVRQTGIQQALRRTGQVSALRRTGTMGAVGRGTGSEGRVSDDRMTDGMRARRREMERRRRRAALERMRLDAEIAEGWQRVWKTASLTVLVLSLAYGYWRIQQTYGDSWPLLAVWGLMTLAMVSGFGWILWYMNRGDA